MRDSSTKAHERGVAAQRDNQSRTVGQPAPTVPLVLSNPETRGHQHAGDERSYWPPTAEWSLVIVTLALTVYTGLLFRATKNLATDARRVARRQDRRTKESIAVARQAAEAALTSANSLMASQRAFVTVTGLPIKALPAAGEAPRFGIEITNVGSTPAHDVDFSIHWAISKYPHGGPGDFPQIEPMVFGPNEGFVLDPGVPRQLHTTVTKTVNQADAAAIRTGWSPGIAGNVALNVHGYVWYKDVFGQRHVREFCVFWGGESGTTTLYCSIHNSTREEEKREKEPPH